MLQDIDAEMERRGLNGILVDGESTYGNSSLFYVVGAHLPRGGIYVKKREREPLLVVANIDLESAKRGRVQNLRTYTDYGYEKLAKRHGRSRAAILLRHRILREQRMRGRIGLYGSIDAAGSVSMADQLRALGHGVVGERPPTLLDALREVKDAAEIDRIRDIGRRTEAVISEVLRLLRSCTVRDGQLYSEGRPLLVGLVKSQIRRWLAERSLLATEDVIFAVGPKSADPHYPGQDADPVLANEPIVFDLFPQEPGGYWFDTTRTYVVGRASSDIRRMYETVLEAQLLALDACRDGAEAASLTDKVCEKIQARGFKTVKDILRGDADARMRGFNHGLGHGVGLTLGDSPSLGLLSVDRLRAGQVVTVEPGLYEPGVGGVRLEDVVAVTESGVDNLSHLGKELEI